MLPCVILVCVPGLVTLKMHGVVPPPAMDDLVRHTADGLVEALVSRIT